jgi:hypothetical protein
MEPMAHLNAPRGRPRSWGPALLVAGSLALALAQSAPAAAWNGGAPAGGADGGCTRPRSGRIPDELRAFVLPGTHALCAAGADLNADGLKDWVLVLEEGERPADPDGTEVPRPLLVVVRDPGGALRVAERNDRLVPCAVCGGAFVEPFEGVQVGSGTFTVYDHASVSARWREEYTFRYVRSAGTWRLARVVELTYDPATGPQRLDQRVFGVADFGDIDLADFEPQEWSQKSTRD